MKTIWTAFNWNDYDCDTEHLTILQHGAYFLLLKYYYKTSQPLNADAMHLHHVCRANSDEEREAISEVLQQFFILDGNYYRHKRADLEIAKCKKLRTKKRKAAQSRWNARASASALQMESHIQSHIQLNTKSIVQAHFAIPSIAEITAYCQERLNQVDPQQFFNHYTSNGWMVGKVHMKDWRASVRKWERNSINGNGQASKQIQKLKRSYDTIAAVIEGSAHNVDSSVREVRKGTDQPGSLFVDGSAKRAATGSN